MRARTVFVSIVAAVLVMTMANVSWADWGGRGWYPPPAAPAPYGWYGHPYYHHGYRYYCAPRAVYVPPPRVVYVPAPAVVYSPWVAGSGYRYPEWGFRFRFTDTNRGDSLRRDSHVNSFWGRDYEPAVRVGGRFIPTRRL